MTVPFITQHRGAFFIVWAESHDAPFDRDRKIGKHATYTRAERACIAAYGVTPQPYGVGF